MKIVSYCSFVILFLLGMAQIFNRMPEKNYPSYEAEWQHIDQLSNQGLIKDVIKQVESLLQRAEREDNFPQQYKCIMTLEANLSRGNEEGVKGFINGFEKRYFNAKEPLKSLIASVLGSAYWSLYSQNLYGRRNSNIEGEEQDNNDVNTWSPEKLLLKSNEYYLNSVKAEIPLTELNIDLKAILVQQGDSLKQPYLYDVLLQRAVSHFSNAQSQLANVQNSVSSEILFSPIDKFVSHEISNKAEPQELLVLLFQNAIRYHQSKNNKEAIVFYDLQRLKTFYQSKVNLNNRKLYISAIQSLFEKYKNESFGGNILFAEAELYYTSIDGSNDGNDLTKTDSIISVIIKNYSSCEKYKAALSLKESLYTKNIKLEFEEVVLPNKPIKMQVEFNNTTKMHYKIFKVNNSKRSTFFNNRRNNTLSILEGSTLIINKEETWGDHAAIKKHVIDIKIDPLDYGLYFIAASYDNFDFNVNDEISYTKYVSGFFQVSNLANFIIRNQNGKSTITTVDRTSGEPISNVLCELYKIDYRSSIDPQAVLSQTLRSSKDGFIESDSKDGFNYFVLKNGNDQLYSTSWIQFFSGYHEQRESFTSNVLFTDRSLYRPGQIVYYKGLHVLNDQKGMPTLKASVKLNISLKDVNGNLVSSKSILTNEYGTFAGEFTIPLNGLKGSYSILVNENYVQQIQVEEYKRPKFEIIMDTTHESYLIGDELVFSGLVQSFSGVALDYVNAKYRIVRIEQIPYFPCWYSFRSFNFSQREEEIENASLITDEKGRFSIKVKSTAFEEGSSEIQKVYQYRFTIDVTDKNGETQSGSSNLQVSNKAFSIKTNLVYNTQQEYLKKITVETENLNLIPIDAELDIKVFELISPTEIMRPRLTKKPDVFKYSKAEFKSWFPEDVYNEEDDISTWGVKKLVFQKVIKSDGSIDLDLSSVCNSTSYKIEIVAKRNGQTIELKDYFLVINSKDQYPFLEPMMIQQKKSLSVGSSFNSIFPKLSKAYYVYHYNSSFNRSFQGWKKIPIDNGVDIKLTEGDKGGLNYGFACVLNNRFYQMQSQIEVPWEKELTITTKSFRDKLLPGQKENWTFTITGKSLPVNAAEILASMYDASLDKIMPHQWNASFYPTFYHRFQFESNVGHRIVTNQQTQDYFINSFESHEIYELNLFGCEFAMNPPMMRNAMLESAAYDSDGSGIMRDKASSRGGKVSKMDASVEPGITLQETPQVRKNLAETIFFYPFLKSDNAGNVQVNFTMNEALTKWKLNLFAHTKDLKYGFASFDVVTWKPIQVLPNYPRFFRQGDRIVLNTKISNVSDLNETVDARIDILDLNTNKSLLEELKLSNPSQSLNLLSNESKSVSWVLDIPKDETRTYIVRFTANGKTHSDGEENIVPVLSNRKLVTETLPLPVKGNQTKSFDITRLTKSLSSSTAVPFSLTIEQTSHPVWYAVQALPYIMEYPHQCAEQTMSRFYANSLGAKLMTQFPRVSQILKANKSEMKSPLEKNSDLKSALLEETPWLSAAKNETEQMAQIELLMDLNKMANEKDAALHKLEAMQYPNGGFPWMEGGPVDLYMTQHITLMLAQLFKLKVLTDSDIQAVHILNKSRQFCDESLKKNYNDLKKLVEEKKAKWEDHHLDYITLHYLYIEYILKDRAKDPDLIPIRSYYLSQIQKYWHNENIYWEGLCALILHDHPESSKPVNSKLIAESLRQRAIVHEELGMYWKNTWSCYWYQAPVESQALMIELFHDVENDFTTVDQLKIWLLKNKQTTHWNSTKATTSAIYAILAFGQNYIDETKEVKIEMNQKPIVFENKEIASAYAKKTYFGNEIKSHLGEIKLTNPNSSIAWGAIYYQYFEQMDQIESSVNSPLKLSKEVYIKSNSSKGPILSKVDDQTKLKIGDILTSRIIIKVDRDMEYVHLKDMRASGLEIINQLSGYKWNAGLGYYESPGDLATHFFIQWLGKGTYVLEYDTKASQVGEFSNGISTIQSMYAPEFAAHSQGIKLEIVK